jgi:hypothetical protein
LQIDTLKPALTERIDSIKDELKELVISGSSSILSFVYFETVATEAEYTELKTIPQEKYGIKEYVQLKVFELNHRNKMEKEQLQRKIDNIK